MGPCLSVDTGEASGEPTDVSRRRPDDYHRLVVSRPRRANYHSLNEARNALSDAGLGGLSLFQAVSFTKGNKSTGRNSSTGRSYHAIEHDPNLYERAISSVGGVLETFNEAIGISCYGFGHEPGNEDLVFCFYEDESQRGGIDGLISQYRNTVPIVKLGGPTSFAPVIEAAMSTAEESGGAYNLLVIYTDGQVRGSAEAVGLEGQEMIDAIVKASRQLLSVMVVGVGAGPWDTIEALIQQLRCQRLLYDNFKFVKFSEIVRKGPANKPLLASTALNDIPEQYKTVMRLRQDFRPSAPLYLDSGPSTRTSSVSSEDDHICCVCLSAKNKTAFFPCGHQTCRTCGEALTICPLCRGTISEKLLLR